MQSTASRCADASATGNHCTTWCHVLVERSSVLQIAKSSNVLPLLTLRRPECVRSAVTSTMTISGTAGACRGVAHQLNGGQDGGPNGAGALQQGPRRQARPAAVRLDGDPEASRHEAVDGAARARHDAIVHLHVVRQPGSSNSSADLAPSGAGQCNASGWMQILHSLSPALWAAWRDMRVLRWVQDMAASLLAPWPRAATVTDHWRIAIRVSETGGKAGVKERLTCSCAARQ